MLKSPATPFDLWFKLQAATSPKQRAEYYFVTFQDHCRV